MNYNLENKDNKIYLSINNHFFCYFVGGAILSKEQIQIQNTLINIEALDNQLKLKFSTNDFEVISIFFNYLTKINSKIYSLINDSDTEYYINVENSTLVSNKNLIIGIAGQNTFIITQQSPENQDNLNLQPLSQADVVNTLMYIPNNTLNVASFRVPPAFSISLYKDSGYTVPLTSYKDRQIISGFNTVFVNVICNLSTLGLSTYTLISIDSFNNIKKYPLVSKSNSNPLTKNLYQTGITTQINFTKSDFKKYFDGSFKFFVSVNKFIYSNTLRAKSLISSSGDSYNPINVMATISTSHIKSANIRVGVTTYSFSRIGYSSLSAFPSYIYNLGLSSYNSFPTLNTSNYVNLGYNSTYNNQIGASVIYNFGTSASGFNTFSIAGITFISEDDLSTSYVDPKLYDVKFLFRYSNSVEPLIISPLPQNIFSSTITSNQTPYNFISARIPFSQLIDPSKTLLSFEARVFKSPSYTPINFRVYEFKIFNYGISTIQSNQFNTFRVNSNSPEQSVSTLSETTPDYDIQSILGIKKGDVIYGYDNQIVKTTIIEIYEGINENIFTIHTEFGSLEIPESYQVYKNDSFVNLWKVLIGDEILSSNGYTKVINIFSNNYKPHFVINTNIGNYFANGILVKPQIMIYHKKTKIL